MKNILHLGARHNELTIIFIATFWSNLCYLFILYLFIYTLKYRGYYTYVNKLNSNEKKSKYNNSIQ